MSYRVTIVPELAEAYERLPPSERLPIQERLEMLAEAAEDAARTPPRVRRPHAKELAVVSPGTYRVFLGDQWIAYRVRAEDRTLQLLDFGSWSVSPLARQAPPASEWHSSGHREDSWDNEGGGSPPYTP
ncbi:type II toxin-antitoxin system RelE family toxin [Myxococcus sp. Y35]|uniref:type II toxin-antitoxin system RelE family toxin n=1 Tax=Pseudomyxococcus flavus TaxID=3115648 RepID=UPI003CF0AD11